MKNQKTRRRCWSILLAIILLITIAVPLTVLAFPSDSGGNAASEGTGDPGTPPEGTGDPETPPEGAGDPETPPEGTGDPETPPEGEQPPGEGDDPSGEGNPPSGSDSNTSTNKPSSSDSEEPEKTLEELRDDLLAILGSGTETAELREKINRMIALGDPQGTLRIYLEGMVRLRQIAYEQEVLENTIDALEKTDPEIGEISKAAAKLEEADPDPTLLRIEKEISAPAAKLMEDAGFDGTGELAEIAASALERLDGTANGRDVAAILLLMGLRESGQLTDAGIVMVDNNVRQHFNSIQSRSGNLTSLTVLEELENASVEIARRANKAESMSPRQIVVAGSSIVFNAPVFTYNGTVMLSLEDAAGFIGGTVTELAEDDAAVIQAKGAVLEMVRGSSDAYLNDKLQKMDAPLLTFDKVGYLPLNIAVKCCGMECMTIGSYQLVYMP